MSGFMDGVNKVFIVRANRNMGLDIEGFKDFDEAAMQCLFTDSWKPEWEARVRKFQADLEKRITDSLHEHDWVDAVEGPEVVGKVCSTCSAMQEPDYD